MKSNLQVFNFETNEVRTVTMQGEAYFVLADVCKVLDIKNSTDVAKRLEVDERSRFNLGRQGYATVINESGLYAVILRSDKPQAKQFRKWITSEVLPTLRKTGTYFISDYKTENLNLRKKNAEIRMMYANAKLAEKLMKASEKVAEPYKTVLLANATKTLTGEYLLPLPKVDEKLYEAKEIGQMLGISANKVGRLANKYGLKTKEYGEFVWNKVPNMDKQVQSFMYRILVVNALRNLLAGVA